MPALSRFVLRMSAFRQSIEDQFNAVVISTGDSVSPASSASRRLGFSETTPISGESLSTVNLIGGGDDIRSASSSKKVKDTTSPSESVGSKRKEDLLTLHVLDPTTVGVSVCGGIKGQAGKICIVPISEDKPCTFISHRRSVNKIKLETTRVYVRGSRGGAHQYIFETPSLAITEIDMEVFGEIIGQERTYEEWVHVFEILEKKKLSLSEFVSVDSRLKQVLSLPSKP